MERKKHKMINGMIKNPGKDGGWIPEQVFVFANLSRRSVAVLRCWTAIRGTFPGAYQPRAGPGATVPAGGR